MNISNLYLIHPQLFWSGVGSGSIPYSEAPGNLAWGAPVQSILTESFLGGPHAPDYRQLAEPTNGSAPSQFGESGAYPKPWRSAAQRTQNAAYTTVGPYAAMIGVGGESLCCTSEDPGKIARVYGRFGVATSGPNVGQGAFFPQDWYSPSEGTYNADYWNTYFAENQPPGLVPEWQLRPDWWGSISKVTIQSKIANTGVDCTIEVAYKFLDIEDPEWFPGLDLGTYPDASLDILLVMVATAVALRWL
tara:strand:- start:102 stop:842 length:741 start_codon:yes stop_codon:yes gene_type:complete